MTAPRLTAPTSAPALTVHVDGRPVRCVEGQTVAAVLLEAGVTRFRITPQGRPRAPLCNMGTCFDCVVTIDDRPLTRSCLEVVREGMTVTLVQEGRER